MTSFLQDLKYGLQMLVKNPGFTAIAVLTIAIGVGANTALFSVVDAVLLKKLPVNDPDRLVLLKASWNGEKFGPGGFNGSNRLDKATGLTVGTSFPMQTYTRLRQEPGPLSDVFAFSSVEMNLNAGGQAEVVSGQVVSGNYYSGLGVPAIVGRTITDADDYRRRRLRVFRSRRRSESSLLDQAFQRRSIGGRQTDQHQQRRFHDRGRHAA